MRKPRPLGGTLVIQPLPGLGDMVSHLRALKAIERQTPDRAITLLTREKSQADVLFGHEPWSREILWLDERRHFGAMGGVSLGVDLKPYKFDTVWVLHHSPRYYIAASFAGIPIRYGYGYGWLKDLLTTSFALTSKEKSLHPIKKFEKLFKLHGLSLNVQDHVLTAPQAIAALIHERFAAYPKPWIAIGYGASNPLRVWPADRFIELASKIEEKENGTFILCGSPEEKSQGKFIQKALQAKGMSTALAAGLSLEEMMALLSHCYRYIGNDNSLLDVAGALGIPSVGIFAALGAQFYSLGLYETVLAYQRQRTTKGIKEISVAEVLDAYLRLDEE
jgi:heptosyltransferase-2